MAFASYPSLADRKVLVTGGASGIGATIVEHFATQGARVAFLDIDDAAARACIGRCAGVAHAPVFRHCDLRDIADLRAAIDEIASPADPIRILVNNAANDVRAPMTELSVEAWDEMMAVNLRHVAFASQAVFEGMRAMGGGAIVNFTTPSIRRRTAGLAAYATAKAGIEGLTRILAREFGTAGVRVNTVMPGWTMTEKQRTLWLTPEAEKDLLATQCLKQFVEAEDVARLVLFLAADDSRLMTAQTYMVDAGLV